MVVAFQQHARHLGADDLEVVVTAPARIGANPGDLVQTIERAAGTRISVLSPEEEARLCFLGAASLTSDLGRRLAVCDVGGGSTEVATGTARGGVERTFCFETGALSLAQRHLSPTASTKRELEAVRAEAEAMISLDPAAACDVLLATGGSARAVAKLVGHVVDAAALDEALELSVNCPKWVIKRLSPRRRQSLPAGIILLSVMQSRLGLPMTISPAGLRDGVMAKLLNLNTDEPSRRPHAAA